MTSIRCSARIGIVKQGVGKQQDRSGHGGVIIIPLYGSSKVALGGDELGLLRVSVANSRTVGIEVKKLTPPATDVQARVAQLGLPGYKMSALA
jgi:hypothetical protein